MVLAAAIVVIGYQIRMRFGRPDVPLPVSATIRHFAPGLAIGASLRDARRHLQAPQWRPGLGYSGQPKGDFARATLIPSLSDRNRPDPDLNARVEVVELTASNKREMVNVMSDLAIVFRGIPRMGCIARLDGLHEEVQYWVTRRDLGGIAVITGWGGDTTSVSPTGIYTWSLVAWAGPFKGSETLTAPFDPRPCARFTAAVTSAAMNESIATREQAQTSFVDSLRGHRP
jgi:hypothetical protein